MSDCNTVQAFLDAGGIVAVVLLFIMKDIIRMKGEKAAPLPPL